MSTCRGWLVVCLTAAALLSPHAAFALDLDSVTDTVADPVKPVTDQVKGAVGDSTGDATQQIEDQVDPVLDKVRGPVNKIVEDIVGPVREVTDPVVDDEVIDTVTDGVLGGGKDGARPDARARRKARRAAAADQRAAPAAATVARRTSDQAQPRESRIAAVRAASVHQPLPARGAGGSLADVIADASRTFAFPLAVAGLILLFLAVQHRIDARDPKLADGFDDEELTFA